MKFTEIPYVRADMAHWKQMTEDLTARFKAAQTFEEADAIYREAETADADYNTMVSLAKIRRDIDTRDAFYDGEVTFYNQELPKLRPAFKAWTQATLESPFRPQLEEKYGSVAFVNAEMAAKTFIPELVEDIQKESALTTRYSKLIASAQIPFRGEVYTLSQLSPWKQNPDDEIRREAWKAEGEWYNSHGKELDEIYDQLVQLRHGMGKKLGFEGFTPLGYMRMKRNCYGEEEVDNFRIAVQDHLVPLVKKLYIKQARRQGREFPLSFADKDLSFRSGNPKPVGNPQEILDMGTKFYSELSQETKVFWDFMREHEMMDVESKPGKAGGGYCSRLANLRSPFIFANFNGTAHDVEVVTHEAGHAFAGYVNRDRVPADTQWPSLEGCEVHSMAMEFFAEPWAEGFFGEDARKFRFTHLADALKFIPYGTLVDHFQHEVYAHPEYTPEQRHDIWRRLLAVYMPWAALDDVPFYGEGKGWQRQSHIYKRPFYYIDYCLAQTVALQFWLRIRKDTDAAFKTYLQYTMLGGSQTFTKLLESAGLDSPFDEGCMKAICEEAERFIDSYDLGGIQ